MPFIVSRDENSNGNLALAAPAFDEEKLLVYREIYFDGFSTVIAARDLTSGAAVAVKKIDFAQLGNCFSEVIQLQRRVTSKVRKQVARIKTLSHPAVMKMLDFVLEPTRLVVISEMCLFGDLFNWMLQQQHLRFRDVFLIIHGLFQAFHFLHGKGYTHGSLKPTNILFQTISPHSLVVLPDLSVKKEISHLLNDPMLSCISCAAPEVIRDLVKAQYEPPKSAPNPEDDSELFGTTAMDVWSIGAIALIALTGINYFQYEKFDDLGKPVESRLERAFSHPILSFCGPKIKEHLCKFLEVDPEKRATAAEGAAIVWMEEAEIASDDRNLLFLMELPEFWASQNWLTDNGAASEVLSVTNVMKHGCVLPPTLFSPMFSAVPMDTYRDEHPGIRIVYRTDSHLLNHRRTHFQSRVSTATVYELLFADDCVLNTTSKGDTKRSMDLFAAAFEDFGLIINTEKTVVMHHPPPNTAHNAPQISVNVTQLQVVDNFTYLGITLSCSTKIDDEVARRISKPSQAFGRLQNNIWNCHGLYFNKKLKMYMAFILLTLMYRAETWMVYKKQARRLNLSHLSCLRLILKLRWQDRVPDTDVLEQTGIIRICVMLRQLQLR
ncbi:hypothetical protein SprV_0100331800 [Sparganum proliferum]